MGMPVGDAFLEASRKMRGYVEISERNWSGLGAMEYINVEMIGKNIVFYAFTPKQARVLASALLSAAEMIDGLDPLADLPAGWDRNPEYGPPPPPQPGKAVKPRMPQSFGVDVAMLGD